MTQKTMPDFSTKLLEKSIQILSNKGTILYPTDTVWGIGCDATKKKAVKRIYVLKKRMESKSLIVLVSSIKMLQKYAEIIPKEALKIVNSEEKPITIIYKASKKLAKNVIAHDGTVAIRMVKSGFTYKLIKKFGKPIVSTSANVSGEPFPKKFSEISTTILKGVDYVVALQQTKMVQHTSKIIRFDKNGKTHVIRH